MQFYLELNRWLYENKFDFKIEVEAPIDTKKQAIPPMLIQPYVENAILHGLMPKEGRGNIRISFKHEADVLGCSIEDDGIGRKHALQLKNKTRKEHQSTGMLVTKKRLEILNFQNKRTTGQVETIA